MDDLDQPSTAGAPAALPGFSRTIRQHAPRRRGRAATNLGVPLLWQDEAADLRQLDGGMHRDAGHAAVAPFLRAADTTLWRKATPQSVTTWF